MQCVRLLVALGLAVGCCASAPGAPEPTKLTEKDVEEAKRAVKAFVEAASSGNKEEQVKAILALLPTDKEIEGAFPKHAAEVKKFYAEIREAIPKSAKLGRKDERGEVTEITIEDARVSWPKAKGKEQKLLAIIPPTVPIVTPEVKRKMSSGPTQPFMRVNGRWVLLLEAYDLAQELKLPDGPTP